MPHESGQREKAQLLRRESRRFDLYECPNTVKAGNASPGALRLVLFSDHSSRFHRYFETVFSAETHFGSNNRLHYVISLSQKAKLLTALDTLLEHLDLLEQRSPSPGRASDTSKGRHQPAQQPSVRPSANTREDDVPHLLRGLAPINTRVRDHYLPDENSVDLDYERGKSRYGHVRDDCIDLGPMQPTFHYTKASIDDGVIWMPFPEKDPLLEEAVDWMLANWTDIGRLKKVYKIPQKHWEIVVMIHEGMQRRRAG